MHNTNPYGTYGLVFFCFFCVGYGVYDIPSKQYYLHSTKRDVVNAVPYDFINKFYWVRNVADRRDAGPYIFTITSYLFWPFGQNIVILFASQIVIFLINQKLYYSLWLVVILYSPPKLPKAI